MEFDTRLFGVVSFATAILLIAAQPTVAQTMALPGKLAVSTSGAATYTIPIAIPPGTAGVAPSLSFEYSSHDGDGLMGIGWSLGGLPSIGRCPMTVAQDGVKGGVNYDSNDRFCLDGQRLFNVSGLYGGDGTQYRTEVDNQSRIISHGIAGSGPSWFEVRTKTGQIMEFGRSADSLILAQGKSTARKWALNKVSDTTGSYFTISYANDAVNGQFFPSEINYTGNSVVGRSPYNKVQFVYTTRPDITSAYQAGSLVRSTQLLTNVKAFADGALVGDYRITYQQDGTVPVSRVGTITLCASDGACLPASSFGTTGAWNGVFVPGGFQFPNGWSFGSPPQSSWMLITGDFNGDGKSDFAMLVSTQLLTLMSNGDMTFTEGVYSMPPGWDFTASPASIFTLITGDFNGDGKSDFACLQNNRVYTFLSNGDGSFVPNIYWFPGGLDFGAPATAHWILIPGDFNGDGRSDFAMLQGSTIVTLLSTGDGLFTAALYTMPNGMTFGDPAASAWTLIAGDFDGDGKSDFALVQGATLITFTSSGDGGYFPNVYGIPNGWSYGSPPHSGWIPLTGDFNGDGKSDFAMLQGTRVQTFLSKGDGSFIASNFDYSSITDFGNPPQSAWMPVSGDFNGDGKTDFAMLQNTTLHVFLSKGDGSFAAVPQSTPWNFGSPPTPGWMFVPGDFDGDGKADIAMVQGIWGLSHSTINTPPFHLLSSVNNGLGATTTISYAPITSSSVYAKDSTAIYPVQNVQNSLRVVSRVDASNGVGGNYGTSYSYAGAKVDGSRGFLGFRQTVTTDLQTNIVQTTNFRQDFPFIGMLDSATKTRNGQTLNQTVNTYQFQNASGAAVVGVAMAPYRASLSQSVESNSDLGGTPMPTTTKTFQYDAYNNATQVAVVTSDGYSKTTNNTYTNDTTNWFLGRLTASTVTSQAPHQLGQ